MTVGELLDYVVAELPDASCRVCGNAVLIGPKYEPEPVRHNPAQPLSTRQVEQKLGPPVSLALDKVPLADALDQLRRQTGANIVCSVTPDTLQAQITATLDNVRLFTALTVMADMAGAKLVVIGSVYYVTTQNSAVSLKRKYDDGVYGSAGAK